MTNINDTIAAISTPAGKGGIAVIRISGPDSINIVQKIWKGRVLGDVPTHSLHFGNIMDGDKPLDEGVVSVFRAPHSYTGEDVVEISIHGSIYIQRRLLNILIENGCRLADPGEFTLRAFSAGKMDLVQAESVADLISSTSEGAHRVAMTQMKGGFSKRLDELRASLLHLAALLELELDFSEEEVEFASRAELQRKTDETINVIKSLTETFATGNAVRNGIPVVIVGETNAGKSTLLNLLVGDDRAIVSEIHGTTRDTIEELIDINGHTFRVIDTAGIRQTQDAIEAVGIDRALRKVTQATFVIWVLDSAADFSAETAREIKSKVPEQASVIIISNKIDLADSSPAVLQKAKQYFPDASEMQLSLKESDARKRILEILDKNADKYLNGEADILVTNARHYEALVNARISLERVSDGLNQQIPSDLVAQDLRETLHHLSTITGQITTPDILHHIFSEFCIGK